VTAKPRWWLWASLGLILGSVPAAAGALGIFEGQSDVGIVVPAGTAGYDPSTDSYTLTSAGANAWYRVDALHFLWKKMSGDVSLTADVAFPQASYSHDPNPHRKAMLMLRQTLDEGGAYADAALHGVGLTALQYRVQRGDNTQDIEVGIVAPKTIRIVKRGDVFTLYAAGEGEALHQVGASIKLHLDAPFYVGLGLTSHDPATTDKVVFTHVKLETPPPLPDKLVAFSSIQTVEINDQFRRSVVALTKQGVVEAPDWSEDGKTLLFNSNGRFYTVPVTDPPAIVASAPFDTGDATGCWGEHGTSPDGKWFAVSCSTPGHHGPDVYIVPAAGGTARQVTNHPVSFFRGWSPDGKTIVFTSIRDGHTDLYTIPAAGGPETPLTENEGLNDGAEYSPDGKYIYFNSDRSGLMQLWRMKPDGSEPEQITSDDRNNWYPHIAPDGKTIAFVSYDKDVVGHAPNKDVSLRLFTPDDGAIRTLVTLFGGQGSLDSNTWAPDSKHLAFVAYEMLPAADAGPGQ
jgi:TolB protein